MCVCFVVGGASHLHQIQAYQHSASFVPKLATKVVQWLDLQKDDVLLDIGCGGMCLSPNLDQRPETDRLDGILNAEFAKVLAQGSGSMHGVDSSASMIEAARELCKGSQNSSFDGKPTNLTAYP